MATLDRCLYIHHISIHYPFLTFQTATENPHRPAPLLRGLRRLRRGGAWSPRRSLEVAEGPCGRMRLRAEREGAKSGKLPNWFGLVGLVNVRYVGIVGFLKAKMLCGSKERFEEIDEVAKAMNKMSIEHHTSDWSCGFFRVVVDWCLIPIRVDTHTFTYMCDCSCVAQGEGIEALLRTTDREAGPKSFCSGSWNKSFLTLEFLCQDHSIK